MRPRPPRRVPPGALHLKPVPLQSLLFGLRTAGPLSLRHHKKKQVRRFPPQAGEVIRQTAAGVDRLHAQVRLHPHRPQTRKHSALFGLMLGGEKGWEARLLPQKHQDQVDRFWRSQPRAGFEEQHHQY